MKKLFGLFVCAAVAAGASANLISIKYLGTGSGDSSGVNVRINNSNKNVFAGQLRFNAPPLGSNVHMFCVDLLTSISVNQSFNVKMSSTKDNSNLGIVYAGRIFGKHFKDTFIGTTAQRNDKAAGLQLAIWEALYDQGATFNSTGGVFRVNSGATNNAMMWAQTYYSAITSSGYSARLLSADPARSGQNQLTVVPGPAAIALPFIWFGSALARRRRKSA